MTSAAFFCSPELHNGHKIEADFVLKIKTARTRTWQSDNAMYACCAEHVGEGVDYLNKNFGPQQKPITIRRVS